MFLRPARDPGTLHFGARACRLLLRCLQSDISPASRLQAPTKKPPDKQDETCRRCTEFFEPNAHHRNSEICSRGKDGAPLPPHSPTHTAASEPPSSPSPSPEPSAQSARLANKNRCRFAAETDGVTDGKAEAVRAASERVAASPPTAGASAGAAANGRPQQFTLTEPRRLWDIRAHDPEFSGFRIEQIVAANRALESKLKLDGRDWSCELPEGTVLNFPDSIDGSSALPISDSSTITPAARGHATLHAASETLRPRQDSFVWHAAAEQAFAESVTEGCAKCPRARGATNRTFVLHDGLKVGQNTMIAQHVNEQTGQVLTRKQISSYIQEVAKRDMLLVPAPTPSDGDDTAVPPGSRQPQQQAPAAARQACADDRAAALTSTTGPGKPGVSSSPSACVPLGFSTTTHRHLSGGTSAADRSSFGPVTASGGKRKKVDLLPAAMDAGVSETGIANPMVLRSPLWSLDVEAAFAEARMIWPPQKRRRFAIGEVMFGRNELIAMHIQEKTGKLLTRKQISSHIQVLLKNGHGDPHHPELAPPRKAWTRGAIDQPAAPDRSNKEKLGGRFGTRSVCIGAVGKRAMVQVDDDDGLQHLARASEFGAARKPHCVDYKGGHIEWDVIPSRRTDSVGDAHKRRKLSAEKADGANEERPVFADPDPGRLDCGGKATATNQKVAVAAQRQLLMVGRLRGNVAEDKTKTETIVGRKCRVEFDDAIMYVGDIVDYDPTTGLYQIDYEDGDTEWTQIPSDGVEVLQGPTGSAADAICTITSLRASRPVEASDPQVR